MSWAKVDDRANENPKLLKAGPRAAWLWVCGLMYVNRQPTKTGRIPKEALTVLYPGLGKREARRLIDVGLWHEDADCYRVHDYHGWNPELRAKRAQAGRKGGLAKAQAVREGDEEVKQTASNLLDNLPGQNLATESSTCQPRAQTRAGSTPPHPTPQEDKPPKSPSGGSSESSGSEAGNGAGSGETGAQTHPEGSAATSEPLKPKASHRAAEGKRKADVLEVFTFWQVATGHTGAKLDPRRDARIRARLREGFTVEQLCEAIRGGLKDDWLSGKTNPTGKKYDQIKTLLRDAEKVESLIDVETKATGHEPVQQDTSEIPPGMRELIEADRRRNG